MNSWSQKIDEYLLRDEEWKEQIRKIKEDYAAAGVGDILIILTMMMVSRICVKTHKLYTLTLCIVLHINYAS